MLRSSRTVRLIAAVSLPLLLPLLLAACTTPRVKVPGLSTRASTSSARYIGALQGGIVARSGVKLTDSDRNRALEAEYRALEAAPGGQPVAWQGDGITGSVVAAAPYQVGSQNCRQYTHTLTASARNATARGAACRNEDGTWTLLN